MTELQQLNLTEKDFNLIIEGLDAISEKGLAGELMFGIIGAMEVKILQGKLLMLKRYLISQAALRESQDIINYVK